MRIAFTLTGADAYSAHKASGKAEMQRTRILNFINANSGMDWSIGELAHFLGMEKSTVSARLNSMLNDIDPVIEAKAKRKDRRSGVMVRPVGLPTIGQKVLF